MANTVCSPVRKESSQSHMEAVQNKGVKCLIPLCFTNEFCYTMLDTNLNVGSFVRCLISALVIELSCYFVASSCLVCVASKSAAGYRASCPTSKGNPVQRLPGMHVECTGP